MKKARPGLGVGCSGTDHGGRPVDPAELPCVVRGIQVDLRELGSPGVHFALDRPLEQAHVVGANPRGIQLLERLVELLATLVVPTAGVGDLRQQTAAETDQTRLSEVMRQT